MTDPPKSGVDLLAEIEATNTPDITLWWLGHCGFVVKSFDLAFYVDPYLTGPNSPLAPHEATNADLILCTHTGASHMDPATIPAMLKASAKVRVVLPKSAAAHAQSIGVPYERMTTTDSDLRVEYFKRGLYGRIYSVPSAHPELDWTPIGGYPHLGYLMRFGESTIYHAGDCGLYEGIVEKLRPYRVTVAILPINGNGNFDPSQAAQLAEDIGAKWLVPMHHDADGLNRFINHMLGFRPSIGFKVFQPGERWKVPGSA